MTDTKDGKYIHTSISSGFNQHTPTYWRLTLPALGVRYGFRWLEKVGSLGDKKLFGRLGPKRFFDTAAGLWMLGVTGFFAWRTGRDIKQVFAEAVAYEQDKDPSHVTVSDLFQSDNKALAKTRGNFLRYNIVRTLVNTSFFASFIPKFKHSESVDLGLGLNGAYLVSEVVLRDGTLFEQLQSFIDRKINQSNALGEDIRPIELIRLYERYAVDNDPENAYRGRVNTPVWYQSQAIFERMADLMNRSYQYEPEQRQASFTLPKFLYLLGHNLIRPDKVEETLAYVEVANRYGMPALKEVVKSVESRADLRQALTAYPEALTAVGQQMQRSAAAAGSKSHADKAPAPSSHVEKASRGNGQEAAALFM